MNRNYPYCTKPRRLTNRAINRLLQSCFFKKNLLIALISSCVLMKVSALSTEKSVLIIDYLKDNIPIEQRIIYLKLDSLSKSYIPVKLELGAAQTLLLQVKLTEVAPLTKKEIGVLSAKKVPTIQLNSTTANLLDRSFFLLLLFYGVIYVVKQSKSYWQTKKEQPQEIDIIPTTAVAEEAESEPISTTPKFSMEEINWLVNLQQTVEQHMPNIHFDIGQLANDLAISSRHLNRRIRLYTGFSTNQYIQEIRLTTAKKLLDAQAYKSVKAVAYEVGYKDVKYFGQLYKKRFGRLPSTYFKKPQFHKSAMDR